MHSSGCHANLLLPLHLLHLLLRCRVAASICVLIVVVAVAVFFRPIRVPGLIFFSNFFLEITRRAFPTSYRPVSFLFSPPCSFFYLKKTNKQTKHHLDKKRFARNANSAKSQWQCAHHVSKFGAFPFTSTLYIDTHTHTRNGE